MAKVHRDHVYPSVQTPVEAAPLTLEGVRVFLGRRVERVSIRHGSLKRLLLSYCGAIFESGRLNQEVIVMLRSINELKGYTLAATDGDIGEVVECYFDDDKWTVRYLIVDTGGWLMGRRVLISPIAVGEANWNEKKIPAQLTKTQVENSPDIATDKPVSRQHETSYYNYYNYPYYWGGPYLWGVTPYPMFPPGTAGVRHQTEAEVLAARASESGDNHLRSTKEVTGYYIEASDGDIGHVEDFLIEDKSWTIRYIVVDTRNWWPGKKVLVSPEWIQDVSWTDSKVRIELSRAKIKNCPEYDPSAPLSRDYEDRLYRHYGRAEYWSR